jgi:hypothetical protein
LIYDVQNDEYRLATQADIDALLRASYALGFARATLRRALDAAREMVDASAFLAYYEIAEAAQNVLANDPNAVDVRTALCPA